MENCIFCKGILGNLRSYGPNHSLGSCIPCHITQQTLENNIKIIDIGCFIEEKEYSVKLDSKRNKTTIVHWYYYESDSISVGSTILEVPGLLHINPSNIVEKLKLYLCFF